MKSAATNYWKGQSDDIRIDGGPPAMTTSRLCSVCTKAVVSDEGAATFHGALVHGACYPAGKARHDAEVRAAKAAAGAAKPTDLHGLLRRFFLRRPPR